MRESLKAALTALGVDIDTLMICDTHSHVYPSVPGEHNPASHAAYLAQTRAIGVKRHVVLQAKAHLEDAGCTPDAVAAMGLSCARGVVWEDPRWSGQDIEALHARGIRGVRVLYPPGVHPDAEALLVIARKIAPFGWHLVVQAEADVWPTAVDALNGLPCPVVIDHMGRLPVECDHAFPPYQALLRFVRAGGWIKLSAPYYATRGKAATFEPLHGRVRALLDIGWERALWAINWPHVNLGEHEKPDDGATLESLVRLFTSASEARAVLAGNAQRLYGFPDGVELPRTHAL